MMLKLWLLLATLFATSAHAQGPSPCFWSGSYARCFPAGGLELHNRRVLRFYELTSDGANYVELRAPSPLAANYTLTWPADDGTPNQVLSTDGSGVLSWFTDGGGDVVGPASSTDNALARFDGTTGKLLQDSSTAVLTDAGALTVTTSASSGPRFVSTAGTTTVSAVGANLGVPTNIGQFAARFSDGTNDRQIGRITFQNTDTAVLSSGGRFTLQLSDTAGTNQRAGFIIPTVTYTSYGYLAGPASASGGGTAFGHSALTGASGVNNTGVGYLAGDTITTGTTNTFLGYNSDATVNSLTNATAIGANASVGQSNALILGASNVNVGIGTSTPGDKLHVAGNVLMQNASGAAPRLFLTEDPDNGTDAVRLQSADAMAVPWTLTFPDTDGTANQYLQTDGAGVTTWATIAAGGDVVGPASATDNAVARFDTTTGKLIQDSVVTISDTGVMSGASIDATGGNTISNVSMTSVTGILGLANGGTNKNMTPAAGGVVYTDSDSQEVSAAGTSGQVLHSSGAGSPSWSAVDLSTASVTGVLVTSKGGTGQNSTATFPTSGVVTTDAGTSTFTNKTYDADATGNALSNIENDNIKVGAGIDGTKIDAATSTLTGTISGEEIGTFTASFTGARTVSPTWTYARAGRVVTLSWDDSGNGACAASIFTSGANIPSTVRTGRNIYFQVPVMDNSVLQAQYGTGVITTGGVISIQKAFNTSNFSATNNCGFYAGTVTYTTN